MKLIHYSGYEEVPNSFELYDLDNDPDELVDLYDANDSSIRLMKEELVTQLHDIK